MQKSGMLNDSTGRADLVVVVSEALRSLGVVGDDDHRRVHARTHALHLPEGEGAAGSGVAPLDALSMRRWEVGGVSAGLGVCRLTS